MRPCFVSDGDGDQYGFVSDRRGPKLADRHVLLLHGRAELRGEGVREELPALRGAEELPEVDHVGDRRFRSGSEVDLGADEDQLRVDHTLVQLEVP